MRLGKISYYADFFLSIAIIIAFVVAEIAMKWRNDPLTSFAIWSSAVVAGVSAWSFFEYVVHRVLYHHVPYLRDLHHNHHAEPDAFIGAPPLLGIALILFATSFLLLLVSGTAARGATVGMLAGYLGYMLIHHACHHWKPAPGTMLYRLRRHHALHHFHSEEGNFGIITSFWDHVFATALEPADRVHSHRAT